MIVRRNAYFNTPAEDTKLAELLGFYKRQPAAGTSRLNTVKSILGVP